MNVFVELCLRCRYSTASLCLISFPGEQMLFSEFTANNVQYKACSLELSEWEEESLFFPLYKDVIGDKGRPS